MNNLNMNAHDKTMRVKIIAPINTSAYNTLVLKAVQEGASPSTVFEIDNITQGQDCIESIAHWEENAPHAARLIHQAEQQGYDGVFICDMDMCGIELAQKKYGVRIPLQGGFSSNMPLAVSRGNFILLACLQGIIALQKPFIEFYGQGRCVNIDAIGFGVHQMLHDRKTAFNLLFDKACEVLNAHKSEAIKSIVLGCTGFIHIADDLTQSLRKAGFDDVLVIDPNKTAIKVLEEEILACRKVAMCA